MLRMFVDQRHRVLSCYTLF